MYAPVHTHKNTVDERFEQQKQRESKSSFLSDHAQSIFPLTVWQQIMVVCV